MSIASAPIKQALIGIQEILNEPGVVEVMINKPYELFVEKEGVIESRPFDMGFNELMSLARLISSHTRQALNETKPLLSGVLPEGERVQVVIPPAVPKDTISLAIRKPAKILFTLDDYQKSGSFNASAFEKKSISEEDAELLKLKEAGNTKEFFEKAVRYKKTIVVSGGTGSGKTTFTNALLQHIPENERLITIENVQEIKLTQKNYVNLLYSKGSQGTADISPKELLEASLRLRPDRILPAEILGEEAFEFLQAINTGHPGTITTLHANTAADAIRRLTFMCLRAKSGLSESELLSYITSTVDIFVQITKQNNDRKITEIIYEPRAL